MAKTKTKQLESLRTLSKRSSIDEALAELKELGSETFVTVLKNAPGRAVLIFDLTDEFSRHDFEIVVKANALYTAIADIYSELRKHRKYLDTESLTLDQIYDLVGQAVESNGLQELLW